MLSQFVLRYKDGTYHCLGNTDGWKTLERTRSVMNAQRFSSRESAFQWKNNESHVRHLMMHVVELRAEIVDDETPVPLLRPQWEDFDQAYDDICAATAQEEGR